MVFQNVKKILATSALALSVMTGTTFATVAPESIAFDGISPGDSMTKAVALWGTPVWQKGKRYDFANGIVVTTTGMHNSIIEKLKCKSPKGPSTTDGLSVGAHEKDISRIYDTADKVSTEGVEVEYTYYSHDRKKKIEIETYYDTVIEIKCELTD